MYISIKMAIIFFIVISFYYGIWQFLWLKWTKKYYTILKKDGESYFDFLVRWGTSPVWRLKKRLGFEKIYRLGAFDKLIKLKGVFFILLGCAMSLGLYLLLHSEYAIWVNMQF